MRVNPLFSVFVVGPFIRIVYWRKWKKVSPAARMINYLYPKVFLTSLRIVYRGHSLTPDRGVVLMS